MAEINILLGGFPGRSERGYLGWSGCYLLTTGKGQKVLFDTGGYNERAVVVAKLAERGISPASLDLVILSHLHFDHAANWDVFPKAEIVVHERELAYASSPEADGAVLRFHAHTAFRPQRLRMEAQHRAIRLGRCRICQLALVHHDLRLGEYVPVRGMVKMQVAEDHQVERLGRDATLGELRHHHGALVVATGVK